MSDYSNVNNNNSTSLVDATKSSSPPTKSGTDFDSDDFMELLLVQMTHQNPLEPMDESEMISQMSQMNSVAELQKLNETMSSMERSNKLLSSASMIGKSISYLDDNGEKAEMIVESVELDGDEILLNAGKVTVPYSQILKVSVAEDELTEETEVTETEKTDGKDE